MKMYVWIGILGLASAAAICAEGGSVASVNRCAAALREEKRPTVSLNCLQQSVTAARLAYGCADINPDLTCHQVEAVLSSVKDVLLHVVVAEEDETALRTAASLLRWVPLIEGDVQDLREELQRTTAPMRALSIVQVLLAANRAEPTDRRRFVDLWKDLRAAAKWPAPLFSDVVRKYPVPESESLLKSMLEESEPLAQQIAVEGLLQIGRTALQGSRSRLLELYCRKSATWTVNQDKLESAIVLLDAKCS